MIEISIQVAVALALAFLGLVFGFGRVLLSQFEKRMAERFQAQTESRNERLRGIEEKQATEITRLANLANDVHALTNLLPLRYVQRDDWIRFASQIDHKIDRLGELFTRFTLRLPPNE